MTAGSRPNLGGLFNGSQPPARPGRVNGPAGPTPVVSEPISAPGMADAAEPVPSESRPGWVDPISVVEHYFAVLQKLLELNRDIAVACTRAVLTLPGRVGSRR